MDICLLGPIEARLGRRLVFLGTTKQRALLALLALHVNTRVSSNQLIEGLWGEQPPPSAHKMVQQYVSQLRRTLAAGGADADIVTRGRGYELRLGPDDLDIQRFERLLAGGAPREALALWRGPPLADVADEPFAPVEIRRLEEMRLAALELAIERDLAAGRHREVVAELDALVVEEPLRERLHAQRMLALYRSGRQADALDAFQQARAALVEQIGVEPGPELRRLHDAMLRQDPALDPPATDAGGEQRDLPVALLPAGTVTLLFTDLVASTELIERVGDDEAAELRRAHFRLLRDVVAARGGREVKSLGDGLMVVFGSAVDAVGAAVAMQQAVLRHNRRHPDRQLGVRIGLHAGEPIRDEDDYFGIPVVIARRLCDQAEAGQILTSDLVHALVGSRGGHRFHAVGAVTLKGIVAPVAACELAWDMPRAFPLPPGLAVRDDGPLAGRDDDLAVLGERLLQSRAGERQLVLLSGEPGVGKTRLAIELTRRAHAEGAIVLYGRCDPEPLTPHQPFVEALRHYVETAPVDDLARDVAAAGGELCRILPEITVRLRQAPQPLAGDPDGARFRLFEAVATLLVEVSMTAPLLLVLDDLHSADEASLLLLRHLARDSRPASLLVLGTYRATEVGSSHTLERVLHDLVTEDRFVRRQIAGVDESGVAAMIAAQTGAGNIEAAQRLQARTAGNPFFVGEVLRSLAARGPAEIERALLSDDYEIPAGVRQVIEQRIVSLGDQARRLLSIAAIAGPRFDLALLERASGRPLDELLDTLERATDARLLEELPDAVGGFTFAHALVRDTLYHGLAAARRARLHQLVGEALEAFAADAAEPPLSDLAYHFANAADAGLEKAVLYGRLAAKRALDQLAYEQAALNYDRALAALQRQPEADPHERASLLVALGDARTRAGDRERARQAFLAAAELARALDDGMLLGRAALGLGGEWLRIGKVDDVLLDLGQDALGRLGDRDPQLRIRLLGRVAAELLFCPGQDQNRDSLSAEAVDEARDLGDPATLAAALNARHVAVWGANPAERLELATEQLTAAVQAGDRELAMVGHTWRFADLCELGDIAAAEQELEACTHGAANLRQPFHRWEVTRLRAALAIFRGDFVEGERLAHEALKISMRATAESAPAHYAGQLFTVRWHQGRAAELIEPGHALAREYPHLPVWQAIVAIMHADVGQLAEARDLLAPLAANGFADIPHNSAWAIGLAVAAEATALLGDSEWAQSLYELLHPYAHLNLSAGGASGHTGSAARILGMLASTTGRLELAAAHFETALTANAHMGTRPWEAWTQYEYGKTLLTSEQPRRRKEGERLLEDAHRTARQIGMGGILKRLRDTPLDAHPRA
jgi:class 3 adenylate cyclase